MTDDPVELLSLATAGIVICNRCGETWVAKDNELNYEIWTRLREGGWRLCTPCWADLNKWIEAGPPKRRWWRR